MEVKQHIIEEILIKQHQEISQKVISDIVKVWDREGEGHFPQYLLQNFAIHWIARVSLN